MSERDPMTVTAATGPHDGRCGKGTRRGSQCTQVAGWGTDHPGVGPCKLHGGATPSRHGRYSGIQREALRDLIAKHETDPDPLNLLPDLAALRALVEDFVNRYDVTTAALLAWHESYQATTRPMGEDRLLAIETVADELEALVGPADLDEEEQELEGKRVRRAIRDARQLLEDLRRPLDDTKPRQMLDLADAYRMLDAIGRMVKRIEDIRAQNAISRPEFFRVMGEMGRVVETYNDEPDPVRRLEKIREGWLSIRLA
jgi:hypothetical protein